MSKQPNNAPLIERRYFPAGNLQVREESGKRMLAGYAAVFNSTSEDLYYYREILEPGCFADCLKEKDLDTVALFNHNPDMVLARYPGTLRMKEDAKGLYCEMDLVDTQVARDVLANIEAGNIYQMSFAFTIDDARYEIVDGENIRYVSRVKRLYDVSPVTYPAYKETSIGARSFQLDGVEISQRQLCQALFRADKNLPLTDNDKNLLQSLRGALVHIDRVDDATTPISIDTSLEYRGMEIRRRLVQIDTPILDK